MCNNTLVGARGMWVCRTLKRSMEPFFSTSSSGGLDSFIDLVVIAAFTPSYQRGSILPPTLPPVSLARFRRAARGLVLHLLMDERRFPPEDS